METVENIARRAARDLIADITDFLQDDRLNEMPIVGPPSETTRRSHSPLLLGAAAALVIAAASSVILSRRSHDEPTDRISAASTDVTQVLSTPAIETTSPPTSDIPSTVLSPTPSPTSSTAPRSSDAHWCSEAAVLDAVTGLFENNVRWNPVSVIVEGCDNEFAQASVSLDQSGCGSATPCLDDQRVWLQRMEGSWTLLDAGSGISCLEGETSPAIEVACKSLDTSRITPAAGDAP